MCVAAVAWLAHPRWRLVAIGNRDEYHARPAAPLAEWQDGSGIIAGRDLQGGGTWLGVSRSGHFALVTNYRTPDGPQPNRPSRGALVIDLLQGRSPEGIAAMNAFNLIHAAPTEAGFMTNYPEAQAARLVPGLHGLSNGGFDDPWPKTMVLTAALGIWLAGPADDPEPLFAALADAMPRDDQASEPHRSAVFIRDPVYGTRCSTIVLIGRDGAGTIAEQSFDAAGVPTDRVVIAFTGP